MTINKVSVHQRTFSIAWGDMDALNHVNNARYFDYFQEARIEWLASLGFNLKQTTGPVVVQVACTFLKPVVYPATVSISSYLYGLGRSSMMLDHELHQGDALMAEGTSKLVWVDYLTNKSTSFPDVIRCLID